MAPLLQDRGAVGFKPDASWQAEAEGFAPCLRCASWSSLSFLMSPGYHLGVDHHYNDESCEWESGLKTLHRCFFGTCWWAVRACRKTWLAP